MGAPPPAGVVNPDVEALLDGLDGEGRRERAELIDWLLDQGITVEEIRGTGTPLLLAAAREVGADGQQVSTRAVADAHGIDLELLQRVQRAIGLARVDDPDAAVHLRADAEAAARVKQFAELGLDPENLVLVVRVIVDGLARAAEVMRHTAMAAVLAPGASELQLAQRYQALVRQMTPLLGPWIEDMLFMQLRHMMETEAVTASERAAGAPLPGARHVTVAFADLVGFTRLGETVPPAELEQLANRLAEFARDVAVPPVRFVKTIGDAVMLVCPEPVPLLNAVLTLVEAADTDGDFPRLRAGVASGEAVSRIGDWFGSPVNMASRVTGVARPGAVLVAEPVYQQLADIDRYRWSFAGPRHLKGISGEVRLFRVRRSQPPAIAQ